MKSKILVIVTFLSHFMFSPILLFLKRGGNQHAVDENGEVSIRVEVRIVFSHAQL